MHAYPRLGHPPDTIAAAFAAKSEKTLSAVKNKLPSTGYMDMICAPADIFDTYEYGAADDNKTFVDAAREKRR